MTISADDSDTSSSSSSIESSVEGNASSILSAQEQLRQINQQSAKKIQTLAHDATRWMEKYGDVNDDHLLTNPMKVYSEIKSISNEMAKEWDDYDEKREKHDKLQNNVNEEEFRSVYMNAITEAFADELDDLRQGRIRKDVPVKSKKKKKNDKKDKDAGVDMDTDILNQDNILMPDEASGDKGNVDVQVLVYMLESGMDNWTEAEKKLFIEMETSSQSGNDMNMDVDKLTPHEKRRRLLFGTL